MCGRLYDIYKIILVTEIDENTAIEYIEEDGVNTNVSTTNISDKKKTQLGTPLINNKATAITTSVISSSDDIKKSSNNLLAIEQIQTTAVLTKTNEKSPLNTTATYNAAQETMANSKSATPQQVEP